MPKLLLSSPGVGGFSLSRHTAQSNRRFLGDWVSLISSSLSPPIPHSYSIHGHFSTEATPMDNFKPGPPRANRPPPTVFCYICGRQFGSKSIGIHEPQCLEKWHLENNRLPKSKRREPPKRPVVIMEADGKTVDIEATNEVNWQNAQALMVVCEHCGRRFGEDRIEVHQRSCTAENPAKRVARKNSKGRKERSISRPPKEKTPVADNKPGWKNY